MLCFPLNPLSPRKVTVRRQSLVSDQSGRGGGGRGVRSMLCFPLNPLSPRKVTVSKQSLVSDQSGRGGGELGQCFVFLLTLSLPER